MTHSIISSTLSALVAALLGVVGCTVADDASPAEIRISPAGPAAASLAGQLPRTLSFSDRMGTAQVATLDQPLDLGASAGEEVRAYRAGDVAYWPESQSLVVFLSDGAAVPDGGLVAVGAVDGDLAGLADCVRDCPFAVAVAP
mgnify:FL=1|jgi:hypothetical protein